MSFINVPVPTQVFLELTDALRRRRLGEDPVETVNAAIALWLEHAASNAPAPPPGEQGYRWKQLFLPHATRVRMKYRGEFHYASVEGDAIRHKGADVSPSEFAHRVTGTSRNAWRDLEIRRPGDSEWQLAEGLREEA